MKSTFKTLFVGILILTLLSALVFYSTTTGYIYPILGEERRLAEPPPRDMPPPDVAKYFWQLSKKGDFQQLENLITKPPPSYLIKCVGENNRLRDETKDLPVIDAEDEEFKDKEIDHQVWEQEQLSLLRQDAETINLSQFQDITIKNYYIYDDEAVVESEYAISNNYSIHETFFMKKENNSWKIFIASGLEKSIYNENYAKPRPPCTK